MEIILKKTVYTRKKHVVHDSILQNWHVDSNAPQAGRKRKLIHGLSDESNFNDDFVTSIVSDEPELLCFRLK